MGSPLFPHRGLLGDITLSCTLGNTGFTLCLLVLIFVSPVFPPRPGIHPDCDLVGMPGSGHGRSGSLGPSAHPGTTVHWATACTTARPGSVHPSVNCTGNAVRTSARPGCECPTRRTVRIMLKDLLGAGAGFSGGCGVGCSSTPMLLGYGPPA